MSQNLPKFTHSHFTLKGTRYETSVLKTELTKDEQIKEHLTTIDQLRAKRAKAEKFYSDFNSDQITRINSAIVTRAGFNDVGVSVSIFDNNDEKQRILNKFILEQQHCMELPVEERVYVVWYESTSGGVKKIVPAYFNLQVEFYRPVAEVIEKLKVLGYSQEV